MRNQDDELNLRIRRAGGRIVLDPSIRVSYTPRGSYRKVFRQYFEYGLLEGPGDAPARPGAGRAQPRAGGARRALPARWPPRASCFPRRACCSLPSSRSTAALGVAAAVASVRRREEPLSLAPRVLAAFPAFHVGYGTGMARALLGAPGGAPAPAPQPPS